MIVYSRIRYFGFNLNFHLECDYISYFNSDFDFHFDSELDFDLD
jgi:hypothetical protein